MHLRTVPMMLWILLITRIKNCQSFHQLSPSESVVLQTSLGISEPEAWQPTDRLFSLKGLVFHSKMKTSNGCKLPPGCPLLVLPLRTQKIPSMHNSSDASPKVPNIHMLWGINGWHQNHLVKNWIHKQHASWRYLLTATTSAVCNVTILELVNRR